MERKMYLTVLCVCVLAMGSMSQANLVTNGDFDGNVAGWNFSANQSGYNATHDVAYFGWANERSIWQNTGADYLADTVYEMTVVITSPTANNTNQYRGAQLVLISIDDSWTDVSTYDYWFPEDDRLTEQNTVGTYRTVEMTFDTAGMPSVAETKIGVGIRGLVDPNQDDGSWGPNGWMYVQSVSVVPEPATIALLGLGAVVAFKRRK